MIIIIIIKLPVKDQCNGHFHPRGEPVPHLCNSSQLLLSILAVPYSIVFTHIQFVDFLCSSREFQCIKCNCKVSFSFRFFDMLEQKKSAHVAQILKSLLCWLPLKERIKFKILLVTYKILHGFAPIYSNELLFNCTPHRLLRSSSINLLSIPKTRTRLPMGRQILLSDCTKALE